MSKTKKLMPVLSVIAAICFALPIRAAEQKSQAYAVVVGISQYADPQILPRPLAEDDARAFYDTLTDKGRLGLDADHIRLLLGKVDPKRTSQVATHENIVNALRWASGRAAPDDVVMFVFIGQGAPLGERSCFFAADSTFKGRAKNAVSASEIENAVEKTKSDRFCAFVDVNYKGFNIGKEAAPEINLSNFYREFLSNSATNGKEEHSTPPGRMVFVSSIPPRPSVDLAKHGIFSQIILDGLSGKADREGYEPDGEITIDELVEYVNKELPAAARAYGKNHEEKEQRHLILGSRNVNYVLVHNPAVQAKINERLDKFNRLAQENNFSKKLTDEGRNLLAQMPKLEAYRSLRKEYQKLADGAVDVESFQKGRRAILDGMKLTSDDALEYAAKIIQASQLLQREYVKKVNQGELIASAIKGLYTRVDEKIPGAISKRLEQAKDMPEADLTKLVADARQMLGKREDLENHKDLDFALQHMMAPLDPYTTYIDPETLGQFQRETQGNFAGIGVQIRNEVARDMLIVVTPIKGSPAYRAGLQAEDIITKIIRETDSDGNPLDKPEVISTKGLPINDAVKKIIGAPNTKVKLEIERSGEDKPRVFEITRGMVDVETVLGAKRRSDDSWDYIIDPTNRIAYLRLTSFARHTARDVARVLEYLKNTGDIKGFVLDLRFNPGGLLTSAVEISDMFIDDGLIVTIRPRNGNEQPYVGEHEGSYLDFPMVCLVNGHSASGSEIVAACLQDHHRAIVMGERSYGKGSVQNIQPFERGQIKLTTASFWRPNGKNLNKSSTTGKDNDEWGVKPDAGYQLKLSRKERDELEDHLHKQEIIPRKDGKVAKPKEESSFTDRQLEQALKYLRQQIRLGSQIQAKTGG
jgi:C-terminal peptidase prc